MTRAGTFILADHAGLSSQHLPLAAGLCAMNSVGEIMNSVCRLNKWRANNVIASPAVLPTTQSHPCPSGHVQQIHLADEVGRRRSCSRCRRSGRRRSSSTHASSA